MRDLLVIGGITDPMRAALAPHFAFVREANSGIEYVLTNGHDGIPTDEMDKMPNLKLISNYGVGYDAIDAKSAARRGVLVTHTPDVLNAEVANTTLLLMLACYREILRDDAHARSGAWEETGNAPLTRSPEGAKIGILGMGRIGQEIARRLEIFSPEIRYHARTPKDVPYPHEPSLLEMARKVDCLIVITPGGAATKHLVNREVLEALGPQGTVINIARGSVIDEAAMVACLKEGKLGWAGLDVFEAEPKIPDALKAMPNVVLLPHVGSATVETRGAMGQLVVDNLIDHLTKGTVRTPVPECASLTG
ncbi:MAG: 2-hydroxyacid dehydrogenase [Rhodobacteraceae bacterium]|nr:2-hydroxyacid dehydrogenase [Paracoccaceae bacterium]